MANDLEGTLRVIGDGWLEWRPERPRWALVLLDLCFYTGRITEESQRKTPGMPEGRPDDDDPVRYFGLQLLPAIQERFPDLPVVILSSKPREQVSREFSQHGALAFLPRGEERGPQLLREYIWKYGLIPDEAGEIIGHSKALLMTLRAARRVAADRRNILIRGERGTGKELLARYIHRQGSPQGEQPLVVVDSGALSSQLYGSELFGHRRGAFTGADRDRTGRIVQADGGDLFLDEVGNMPADVQAGLLRVLEQREVTPLGDGEGQTVDVRFLSATNEDLEGKAATGGFRQDLLDRLREGGTVFLRPLRERLEDLDLLVERLVREAERAKPGALRRRIEPEALERLRAYDWPGNIRELRTCICNAVFSYPDVEHLVPLHLQFGEDGRRASGSSALAALASENASGSDALDRLIAALGQFPFAGVRPADLVGKLPALQQAYALLAARLLQAALQATSKPTPDIPNGVVLIHPAIKLLTGNKSVTASKAADIIKRLLGLDAEVRERMLTDPILKEAYETALRLRPSQPPSKGNASRRPG
ncbi:MAG: sigma 54-interacting transcriptional regulator [Planctomycetes bacterium]|nr:sigma 54-interacting transcriptional regulator [Planctomycetota bacterium]